jgi:aromatic-L-amino-acid decarboxylase
MGIDPADNLPDGTAPAERWDEQAFRHAGYAMIDRIAAYWSSLRRGEGGPPVLCPLAPGDVLSRLPPQAPEAGEAWSSIVADLERVVMPGLTHWQSPRFFGYFPANISPPAVLGELLAAGLGVQGMLWLTSPACTELEARTLDWMARLIGLPEPFTSAGPEGGGVIQGTASEATLVALVAARTRARARWTADAQRGPFTPVVYTSDQAHSSVLKAAMIAGLADPPPAEGRAHVDEPLAGRGGVRFIGTDARFSMDPDELARRLEEDVAAGRHPCLVVATLGTTGVMGVDDLERVGAVCQRHGVWLHVDAAFAGSALVCPEHRGMIRGVERADSFSFNPHKWLLTNFDCALFWTRRRGDLLRSLSVTPEYLRHAESASGRVIDYRDWQIPLGRRFRALKLWFVVRSYGAAGLREHVRAHVRLAEEFESWVRRDPRFELPVPRGLSLVCLALRAGDEPTRRLLAQANASGRAFFSHTVIPRRGDGAPGPDRFIIRVAIGGTFTRRPDVLAAWDLLRRTADGVVGPPPGTVPSDARWEQRG